MANYRSVFTKVGGLWETIATDLISRKPAWDFEKHGAPVKAHAKIVSIEIAALFVTVAQRAQNNSRVFERSSITRAYLDAMLKPHGKSTKDLVGPVTRKNAINRTNKSISDDMEHLVFFGLFEVIEERKSWRLTDLGVSCYERFNESIDEVTAIPSRHLHGIPAVSYSGFGCGVPGWAGRELTVHYRW